MGPVSLRTGQTACTVAQQDVVNRFFDEHIGRRILVKRSGESPTVRDRDEKCALTMVLQGSTPAGPNRQMYLSEGSDATSRESASTMGGCAP